MSARLCVSFSGGRTSAYMAQRLRRERPDAEMACVFANTGEEHEETLKFVDRCDAAFGLGVVWVEAVVSPEKGVGTSHRVVDFATACRPNTEDGPFEQVIRKYGIPNRNFPNCTRETKLRPIQSYLRSIGWRKKEYRTAVGIRVDEIDRVSPTASEDGIEYPLVNWGVRKQDVISFWRQQSFDLYIPEHYGNCRWCWKKSLRKHLTIASEAPEFFEFPRRMERMYPDAGPGDFQDRPRRFFRGARSSDDIIREAAAGGFAPFSDVNSVFDPDLDVGGGCEESCEVYSAGDRDEMPSIEEMLS